MTHFTRYHPYSGGASKRRLRHVPLQILKIMFRPLVFRNFELLKFQQARSLLNLFIFILHPLMVHNNSQKKLHDKLFFLIRALPSNSPIYGQAFSWRMPLKRYILLQPCTIPNTNAGKYSLNLIWEFPFIYLLCLYYGNWDLVQVLKYQKVGE